MTAVYVQGYCFGDSQGTISVGGAAVTNIFSWTDFETEFIVPTPHTRDCAILSWTSDSYGPVDRSS